MSRDKFLKARQANGEGKCAFCRHSPAANVTLAVRYPDGDIDNFRFCDSRCHRYFCFEVNPEWETAPNTQR